MRILSIVLIGGLLGVIACGKDPVPTPSFSSPDGKWTYKTPDTRIAVDFELVTTSSGSLDILNATIVVNGVLGQAAAQIFDVDLPAVDSIRINANDATLVKPYYIAFSDCNLSTDFNTIMVAEVEYSFPWGTTKHVSGIVITRKP